jgi:hypothetical protein
MVSKFIYNKSKTNTVILIHGLFATSGFWLNYLPYFKEYKIIIYNIDFYCFFDSANSIFLLCEECTKDFENNRVVGVISHSYGTVISDLIFSKLDVPLFNICPITIAIRVDSYSFGFYLSNKLNFSENKVHDILFLADRFFLNVKTKFTLRGLNLIPDKDEFFNYNFESTEFVIFEGDHFEIKHSADFIKSYLLSSSLS